MFRSLTNCSYCCSVNSIYMLQVLAAPARSALVVSSTETWTVAGQQEAAVNSYFILSSIRCSRPPTADTGWWSVLVDDSVCSTCWPSESGTLRMSYIWRSNCSWITHVLVQLSVKVGCIRDGCGTTTHHSKNKDTFLPTYSGTLTLQLAPRNSIIASVCCPTQTQSCPLLTVSGTLWTVCVHPCQTQYLWLRHNHRVFHVFVTQYPSCYQIHVVSTVVSSNFSCFVSHIL